MVKSIIKKLVAGVLCGVMLVGGSINSYAYRIYWTEGAPSSSVKLSDTATTTATGKNQVTVNSTRFNTVIKGAYVNATGKGGGLETDTHKVNSVNTYKLDYQGSTVPKKGKTITVIFKTSSFRN